MIRKTPTAVYSGKGLKGKIVQSGKSEIILYKGPFKERVEIGRQMRPRYVFVDRFNRTYQIVHYDIEIVITGSVVLNSYDGTFIEGRNLKGLFLASSGGVFMSQDSHECYIDPSNFKFPREGLEVEIICDDAFVWQFKSESYFIDYSPKTLGSILDELGNLQVKRQNFWP